MSSRESGRRKPIKDQHHRAASEFVKTVTDEARELTEDLKSYRDYGGAIASVLVAAEAERLLDEVSLRDGKDANLIPQEIVPEGFVVHQAATRLFLLLDESIRTLHHSLTVDDFRLLLGFIDIPVLPSGLSSSPVAYICCVYQIHADSDLDRYRGLRPLMRKLESLSMLETFVVVDIIERFWRNSHKLTRVEDALLSMGFNCDGQEYIA